VADDPSSILHVRRQGNNLVIRVENGLFGQGFLPFESKSFDIHSSIPHSTDNSSLAMNTTPNFLSQTSLSNRQESQLTNSQLGGSLLTSHSHTEPSLYKGQSLVIMNNKNSKDTVESTLSEPHNVWSPTGFSLSSGQREVLQSG
jgi:hypothetical protein